MSESKHTPGPWIAEQGDLDEIDIGPMARLLVMDPTGVIIAEVSYRGSADELKGNTRLIGADGGDLTATRHRR